MKILVTGGCGFIGSNFIINQLQNGKNSILNMDLLTYAGNIENLSNIEKYPNYSFIQGDICNLKLVSSIISNFKPDCLVHFAAESHVDRSIDNPMAFIKTNVLGTTTLLQASLNFWKTQNHNFKFLHISTDEVFGSLDHEGSFNENTPYDPSSPYSASKASSDHIVRSWHRTYDFPALITNCSNNYGPYQFPEKLIPLMIINCIDQKPLPIYGKGLNIRDWLFVDDHCNAISTVLNNGEIGETYNIGGNNEISNIDIVKIICKNLDMLKPLPRGNSYLDLITPVQDRPGHDFRYAINASKIKNHLKWEPSESFDTGILKTIKWYISNESWWRNIQINNYSQERLGQNKK